MNRWVSNLYRDEGKKENIDIGIIERSLIQAHKLQEKGYPAILTLGHLAFHTGIKYHFLRKIVSRKIDPYRTFAIKKRSGGYRYINVPHPDLMLVQRWIDQYILTQVEGSPFSYAFNKGQSIIDCAKQHLRCNWLIKIDLRHFFESLSEIQVYHIFLNIGYDKLIAFELSRLCTKVTRHNSKKYKNRNWISYHKSPIEDYNDLRIGYLPQGAPTSPKLSNLIVKRLDYQINDEVKKYNLVFTRYADDITLSIRSNDFNRNQGIDIINSIYSLFPEYGLKANHQKAEIIPPGARKIVLGLLVDSSRVRLTKSFRNKLECHLYYCANDPQHHALNRGFKSVLGLKNYLYGLLAYVKQIDSEYGNNLNKKYGTINWPI